MSGLTQADRDDIAACGRDPDAAEAQLAVLSASPPSTRLVRAATVDDGIRRLDDGVFSGLEAIATRAAEAGRISAFVPASGAATRMCRDLLRAWSDPDFDVRASDVDAKVRDTLLHAADLALWPELEEHHAVEGDARSILDAMFGDDGMGLHTLPKGLVPFHPSPDGARTAFDEHLVEASRLARADDGTVRAHFTVGDAHRARFDAALERARTRLEGRTRTHLEVGFSVQDPATDTLAVGADGRPFRKDDGGLLFRPGGHGALLGNLEASGGDIVLVKNIDNVVPEDLRGPNLPWRRRLAGLLVQLQGAAHDHVRKLRREGDAAVPAAAAFVQDELGRPPGATPDALIAQLDRPWRVCGMVKNEGQPGGGPFWAWSRGEVSLQIVESAQVDHNDPDQAATLRTSTHFNPVDMALAMRDADGKPFRLADWVDPEAVIVTEKSFEGRPLEALEHPGLWNGGMAGWNTVFVEVPAYTFQPVKTLYDLLSCTHGGPFC